MTLRLEVHTDAEAAARRVAALVRERVTDRRGEPRGSEPRGALFALALSRARRALLAALAGSALPWEDVAVYQVDERVAPAGSDDRNATALLGTLPAGRLHLMPVDDEDLDGAAAGYEASLPHRFDLVHLGLGADGHTASLVPFDPVLEVRDRAVAVTGEYEGFQRMTLTYPALEAALELVWLVTGAEKREALRRLLDRDPSIPAALLDSPAQLVVADESAAP